MNVSIAIESSLKKIGIFKNGVFKQLSKDKVSRRKIRLNVPARDMVIIKRCV